MLRVVILAMVVVVALGMMIPVATEHAEAGAKEQERQYIKKSNAEKFRYRTRFRKASYSKSERFIQTAKLRPTGSETEIDTGLPAAEKVPAATMTAEVKSYTKVRRAKKARSVAKSRKSRKAGKAVVKKRSSVRYRKVRRFKAASKAGRKVSKRNASKRRSVKRSKRKYTARWWHNYRFVEQAQTQAADSTTETLTQLVMNSDGTVTLVVVGPAMGETIDSGRRRTLAGVSTTALRRTVIEQMITENGWVENDYHKEVDGKKVYVVVAKAPDEKNRIRAKTFYFAESQGKIYRVAASAPKDEPDEAALRSEKMIKTLEEKERPRQAKAKPKDKPEEEQVQDQ